MIARVLLDNGLELMFPSLAPAVTTPACSNSDQVDLE